MALLFDRAAEVSLGDRLITGLRIAFKVSKSARLEPNTAEITVYNLSADTRALLQDEGAAVLLEAGYAENIEQLFLGTAREVKSQRQGTDLATVITGGDGETGLRESRIQNSFARGTSVADVLKTVGESIGVNTAKAVDKLKQGQIRGGITEFVNGFVASGKSVDVLDRLLRSSGLEASVQDGELQVLDFGQPSDLELIRLTPESGLIGSPEVGEKGRLKARSLLQPALIPGRRVQIFSESSAIDGNFRIDQVTHNGDLYGQDWYSDIEGSPL